MKLMELHPWDALKGGSDLSEDPYKVAEQLGMEVHLPAPNELFIDIDSDEGHALFTRMRSVLEINGIHFTEVKIEASRTEGHMHIRATLPFDVTDEVRILLQAVLGSDPKRELLSWLRIHSDMDRAPTVFFEEAA